MDTFNEFFGATGKWTLPDVTLDDNVYYNHVGRLSEEQVKDQLRKLLDDYYRNHDRSFVTDRIRGMVDFSDNEFRPEFEDMPELSPDEGKLVKKAKNIVLKTKVPYVITGKYLPESNTIILYYNAIPKGFPAYLERLRLNLCHEFFHAIHSQFMKVDICDGTGECSVVCESLADFFAVQVSLNANLSNKDAVNDYRATNVALEREDFWTRNRYYDFPYVFARFVCYNNKYSFPMYISCYEDITNEFQDRFAKISALSKVDMRQAYEELVPPDERRIPKNRNKVTTPANVRIDDDGGVVYYPPGQRRSRKGNKIGFSGDEEALWEILKKIIYVSGVKTISELNSLIPSNVLEIVPGKFTILGDGEIISAYPQWKVLNVKEFLDAAVKIGAIPSYSYGERPENGFRGRTRYVLTVEFDDNLEHKDYYCNKATYDEATIGDRVLLFDTSRGYPMIIDKHSMIEDDSEGISWINPGLRVDKILK